MSVQSELLREVETFLARRTGMSETTFGRLAVNDGKFVGRLRAGRNMTLATIERVKAYIKAERATAPAGRKRKAPAPPAPVAEAAE